MSTDSIESRRERVSSRNKDWLALAVILPLVTASFIYAWYFDSSTPQSGLGWADQTLYADVAVLLAEGERPHPGHMHYQMGYPILGALAYQLLPSDPFVFVSYLLLAGSVTLVYFGARQALSRTFTLLFLLALFGWDLHARTLHYPAEIFAIPWNNQVLFFAFAFLLWLLFARSQRSPSLPLCIAVGVVAGLTIATREESLLFVLPLAGGFLFYHRVDLKRWAVFGVFMVLLVLPHLAIKSAVLGSPFDSGRSQSDGTYSELVEGYLSIERLRINLVEVVFDSSRSITDPNPDRAALLQAAPWLWLSPVGLIAYLTRRNDPLAKLYLLVSIGLAVFYLSGPNMSAEKLKFHCLRYLAPSLIAFNFGVIYALQTATSWAQAATALED